MTALVFMTRKTGVALAICLLYGVFGTAIADPVPPEQIVTDITNKLRARLEQPITDPARNRDAVVEIVASHFDFPTLTRAVLGEHWSALSDGEKQCMTTGMRERLIKRYAEYIVDFQYRSIETLAPESISTKNPAFVRQHVVTANPQPLELRYKLEYIDDAWRLTDLSVDDVGLVASHKTSFDEIIARDGIGDFLRTFPSCRER
jgi:ABC-type transporter MlaC component